jgi:hypothetical protein
MTDMHWTGAGVAPGVYPPGAFTDDKESVTCPLCLNKIKALDARDRRREEGSA